MKIAIFTTPNNTIISKKRYNVPSLGTAEIAGGLIEYGHDVEYIDLNAYNYSIRTDELLTDDEMDALLDDNCLKQYLKQPKTDGYLYKMIVSIKNKIEEIECDKIAFSMVRSVQNFETCKIVFNFAVILAHFLRKKPVIGGHALSRELGFDYLVEFFYFLEENPFEAIFFTSGKTVFPEYLKGNITPKQPINVIDDELGDKKQFLHIEPYFDIKNNKDLVMDYNDLFIDEIIQKYPIVKNIKPFAIYPFKFVEGCMLKCAFCSAAGDPVKMLNVKSVVDTLEKYSDVYGIDAFRFLNNNINFNKKWLMDFCNEIVKRNLKINFSDSANLYVVSDEIFSALYEAGCRLLWYGTETFSPRLQGLIRKRNEYEEIISKLKSAHDKGIWNGINLIYAFPTETEEDFNMILKFIREDNEVWDSISYGHFMLMKNSEYYRNQERFGIKTRSNQGDDYKLDYDEINGLTWEETVDIQQERKAKIESSWKDFGTSLDIRKNDGLIFGLSRLGLSKLESRAIIDDYFKILQEKDIVKDVISQMNLNLSTRYVGPHIDRINHNRELGIGKYRENINTATRWF